MCEAKTTLFKTKLRIYILSSTELLSMQEKEEEIEREETTFYKNIVMCIEYALILGSDKQQKSFNSLFNIFF